MTCEKKCTLGGARTHDHKIKSLALYHLSYEGCSYFTSIFCNEITCFVLAFSTNQSCWPLKTSASMAEWSKAVDLSSILRCRRGFEPHSRHFFKGVS